MEKIRALFYSAHGPVVVQEVLEYGREDQTVTFLGSASHQEDPDEYIAFTDEIRLVPVVN